MDWTMIGSIAGVITATVAIVSLTLQVRGKNIERLEAQESESKSSAPEQSPEDLAYWAEWAFDHGGPSDQLRAKELLGYGVVDPAWEDGSKKSAGSKGARRKSRGL
jgi:hypothetical protein